MILTEKRKSNNIFITTNEKISYVNETYYYNLISHYNTLLLLFSFSIKYIIIYLIAVLNIAV